MNESLTRRSVTPTSCWNVKKTGKQHINITCVMILHVCFSNGESNSQH